MKFSITSDEYARQQREKAIEALQTAKILEATRQQSGFQYVRKDSRTLALTRHK